jgi:hypothetical protein
MGKYMKYQRKGQEKPEMNPVWRGIGCLMIVIVPLMSYAVTILLVPPIVASGLAPLELLQRLRFPDWAYTTPVISGPAIFLSSIDNLGLILIGFFVILITMSGLFSLIYSAVYQLIGPPRYTSVDVVPTSHKGKSYKR